MAEPTDENGIPGLDETIARLEALIAEPHISEEYVRFRMDLLRAQWGVRRALAGASPAGLPPAGTGTLAAGPGKAEPAPPEPILDPSAVPFDPEHLRALFSALCTAAARAGRQTEDMQRLRAAVEADPELLGRLSRHAAFGPAMHELEVLSRELRVLTDALLFIGRALAAPFVAEAARRIRAGSGAALALAGARGRCAVCGSPPSLATIRRQDGRRILTCSLCGTRWEFARLTCPWCEQADREALGLLRMSEGEPRWIETCERCRGYLKTVDERKLPVGETIIPVVEEAATLHLDLLAEKEGYIRRLPYVLSG